MYSCAKIIDQPANTILESIASLWEIAVKLSVGKLIMDEPFEDLISRPIEISGFVYLDIARSHTVRVMELPFHHRDPFDRMLAAQALVEDIPVISVDSTFDRYGVTRLG